MKAPNGALGHTARPRRAPQAGLKLSTRGGTVADRVVDVLIEHIRRHRLAPGTPLPSELQASAQLHVSRGIIREAYRALSSLGLVEIANGRSPRVGHVNHRALTQILEHALSTEQASAEQILELRGPIEERAAELAALQRTPEDLTALREAVAAMRAAGTRRDAYVKADIRFHEIIARATGNPLIGLLSSALRKSMSVSIRASLDGRSSRAELEKVVDTHASILAAIEAGRAPEARTLMIQHYHEARVAILRRARLSIQ